MHTNSYAWEHYFLGPIRVKETKTIAKLQIYVERAIRRLKEFHIFDSDIPFKYTWVCQSNICYSTFTNKFSSSTYQRRLVELLLNIYKRPKVCIFYIIVADLNLFIVNQITVNFFLPDNEKSDVYSIICRIVMVYLEHGL